MPEPISCGDNINTHLTDRGRRLDETDKRLGSIQKELSRHIIAVHNDVTLRLDKADNSLNRLSEAIVRRHEHEELKRLPRSCGA